MLKWLRWFIIYLICVKSIIMGLELDGFQTQLVAWAPAGLFLMYLGYKLVGFLTTLIQPWFKHHLLISFFNNVLAVLLLLIGCFGLNPVFFPAQWQLNNSTYVRELQKSFEFSLNWLFLAMFSYGAAVILVPILRAYSRDIAEFSRQFWPQYGERVKTLFQIGADTIDKLSKWAILMTVIVYLTYDRDHKVITESFQRLMQYKEQVGDFGRKDAIENLTERNENVTGINLKNATLEGLDVTGSSLFYRKSRPNLSSSVFSGANLRQSNLSCSLLRGAHLNGAKLRDAVLIAANLEDANLVNVEFGGKAFFRMTDLSYTNLRNANLSDAPPADRSKQNTVEIDDTMTEYLRNGGAFLIGADLRGTKLGESVLGMNLMKQMIAVVRGSRGLTEITEAEYHLIQDFPVLTVLSSERWDERTQFPEPVARELERLGLRDGRVTTPAQRALIDRAKRSMMDVYKQVYNTDRYNLLRFLEMEEQFTQFTDETLTSVTGIGGHHSPGDPTLVPCQELARFGRISAAWSSNRDKYITRYSSYKENPVTALVGHLPYPKWLDEQTRICQVAQVSAGTEEHILGDETATGDPVSFETLSVTREDTGDGRSAIVKIGLRYRDKEQRDRFFKALSQEMEEAARLSTDVDGTIVNWYLSRDGEIPLWIEHGRDQLTIQLFDPAIRTGLSEIEVSILTKGLMGPLPTPLDGARGCTE